MALRRTELINTSWNLSATAIIKNLPKFSQNGIAKKRSMHPSLRNVIQQLDYTSSSKQTVRQQLEWPTIFYLGHFYLGKKCIPSFSIGSHLHLSALAHVREGYEGSSLRLNATYHGLLPPPTFRLVEAPSGKRM